MTEAKPVVYILRGDDREAIEAHIHAFYASLGTPDMAELNITRLEGKTASLNDLRSAALALPFLTEDDREQLHGLLGEGEVSATVEALGPTEVVETAYPGVWWVTYYGADGEVVAERIEVARMPDILAAQDPDMRAGLGRLLGHLPEPAPEDKAGDGPAIRWQDD